jgi:hypothetical protein
MGENSKVILSKLIQNLERFKQKRKEELKRLRKADLGELEQALENLSLDEQRNLTLKEKSAMMQNKEEKNSGHFIATKKGEPEHHSSSFNATGKQTKFKDISLPNNQKKPGHGHGLNKTTGKKEDSFKVPRPMEPIDRCAHCLKLEKKLFIAESKIVSLCIENSRLKNIVNSFGHQNPMNSCKVH